MRFGLLPFRSPLLRESLLISFPGLLRWFTSPSFASVPYFIQVFRCWNRSQRVTPFGYLRLIEYVLLPAAFRSLSRPSSPYSSIGIRHEPIFRLTILFIPHFFLPFAFRMLLIKHASFQLGSLHASDVLPYIPCCFPSLVMFQRSCYGTDKS